MAVYHALHGSESNTRTGKLAFGVQTLKCTKQLVGIRHVEAHAVVAYAINGLVLTQGGAEFYARIRSLT